MELLEPLQLTGGRTVPRLQLAEQLYRRPPHEQRQLLEPATTEASGIWWNNGASFSYWSEQLNLSRYFESGETTPSPQYPGESILEPTPAGHHTQLYLVELERL